jgi:fumarate hydratase subunit alpha
VAVTYDLVKTVSAQLYEWSLKKIPEDTKDALRRAAAVERNESARETLKTMLKSAETAEQTNQLVCSDSGVPVYFVKLGTRVTLEGDIKKAFVDGFDHLVATINPPILKHVTNPLTRERSYKGKDMPIVSYDLLPGADYVDIICSPKALGSGRWAGMEIFDFPALDVIEKFVLDSVIRAGAQTCPPVIVGVGVGGTFDHCAKLAKQASLRQFSEKNPEPALAAMEERLLTAVNETGFGPMGTGGMTTALGVHVEYASGHGFTPVAVCFNCWINRRTRARIYDDGRVERVE